MIEAHFLDTGEKAYKLEGFDFSAYGNYTGYFLEYRFEVISDEWTPDYYIPEFGVYGSKYTIVTTYKLKP